MLYFHNIICDDYFRERLGNIKIDVRNYFYVLTTGLIQCRIESKIICFRVSTISIDLDFKQSALKDL